MPEFGHAVESFGKMAESAQATTVEFEKLKDMLSRVKLFQADVDRIAYFSEHPYVIEENEL